MEFKTFVNAFMRLPYQIVRAGRQLIYRFGELESMAGIILPGAGPVALLTPVP
jgi:hypothetical protein